MGEGGEHTIIKPGAGGDFYIVNTRHLAENADILKRPGDADSPDLIGRKSGYVEVIEKDPPGGGRMYPADAIENGRFPGAVRTDEAGDFSN